MNADLIIGIDPGTEKSAWVRYCPKQARPLMTWGIEDNYAMGVWVGRWWAAVACSTQQTALAIEDIDCYGMPVGRDVFETCKWIGKFEQAWGGPCIEIPRREIKLHLCGTARAKDANVCAALIDRFGPGKDKAIGGKQCPRCKGKGWFGAGRPTCPECSGSKYKTPPGPLYGVTSHVWSALAVAVTYADRNGAQRCT